jgi:hypothetical protein
LDAIEKAGEEGLSLEQVAQSVGMDGNDIKQADAIVEVLQSFNHVIKVNAFDHIRVIAYYSSASSEEKLQTDGRFSPQLDMVHNPAVGLQGLHYLRSSLMEHRDQNARPLIRSILDVSFERLQTLQNKDDRWKIDSSLYSQLRIRSSLVIAFQQEE